MFRAPGESPRRKGNAEIRRSVIRNKHLQNEIEFPYFEVAHKYFMLQLHRPAPLRAWGARRGEAKKMGNAQRKWTALSVAARMNCGVIKLASKHIFHFVCTDGRETNRAKTRRSVQTIGGSGGTRWHKIYISLADNLNKFETFSSTTILPLLLLLSVGLVLAWQIRSFSYNILCDVGVCKPII